MSFDSFENSRGVFVVLEHLDTPAAVGISTKVVCVCSTRLQAMNYCKVTPFGNQRTIEGPVQFIGSSLFKAYKEIQPPPPPIPRNFGDEVVPQPFKPDFGLGFN